MFHYLHLVGVTYNNNDSNKINIIIIIIMIMLIYIMLYFEEYLSPLCG